jgi:hypothetical protein
VLPLIVLVLVIVLVLDLTLAGENRRGTDEHEDKTLIKIRALGEARLTLATSSIVLVIVLDL